MKFYDEEKLLKIRNVLIVAVLALLTILLFFKVYDNFAKQLRLVTSTIFPFILSFVIVYCLMPFIDMISEKNEDSAFMSGSRLNALEKVEKMDISNKEKNSSKSYICDFTCFVNIFCNFSLYNFDNRTNNYKTSIKSNKFSIKKPGKTSK